MKGGENMNDIVFVKEFSDLNAEMNVNEYLAKGWKLLNVGTKLVATLENGQAEYLPCYVLGANQEQYAKYKEDEDSDESSIDDFLSNDN